MNRLLSGYFHRSSYVIRLEEIVKKFVFLVVFMRVATLFGLKTWFRNLFC